MKFNQSLEISCNDLQLYKGEMTLVPHQGDAHSGIGTIELACGGAKRHLLIQFEQTDDKAPPELPASSDGKYGRGTSFMRIPYSEDYYVFVTSTSHKGTIIGEADLISGKPHQECEALELYLLNSLIPEFDMSWALEKWNITSARTQCAYDLTRVSLPNHEINLTHRLTLKGDDGKSLQWKEVEAEIEGLLMFLGFVNRTYVSAPVIYGYNKNKIQFFRFSTPKRVVPLNRRSWATKIDKADLQYALSCFISARKNTFWDNILNRAIEWQILAEGAMPDSLEQALSTTQMLLELLSFVLLVEDSAVLSEDGYSKLPAADRINLLCSHINYQVALPSIRSDEVQSFCRSNSINSVGELITSIRNKLIHPTKKNREYLDKVPRRVRAIAVTSGIQVASLAILRAVGYRGKFYDIITHEKGYVPWR